MKNIVIFFNQLVFQIVSCLVFQYFTRNNLFHGGDRVSKLIICVMEEETEFLNFLTAAAAV